MKRSNPGRWAAAYANRFGWPVVPIDPRGKHPIYDLAPSGPSSGTTDPKTIEFWWQIVPRANVAVVCHQILVLDVDVRRGGHLTFARLCHEHGALPRGVARQYSGHGDGSFHVFFERPSFETRGKLPGGIDIITGNQCVTVAPSVHRRGGSYRWMVPPAKPLQPLPLWLLGLVRAPAAPPELPRLPRDPGDCRLPRAHAYAAKMPPAISGAHGHTTTLVAAMRIVRGFDLTEAEAFEVLQTWNSRCSPPWSARALRRKISQAATQGHMPRGQFLLARSSGSENL